MQNQNSKYYVKKFFSIIVPIGILIPLCFYAIFYVVDPLRFFHKSFFLEPDILSRNMREQVAGIINNYDFDSIILGTSQLENTSAKEAGEKLGGKFFNISIEGGTFVERSWPLRRALQKGLKNVIYSLDREYTDIMDNSINQIFSFAYLYDDKKYNDFKYYATRKNLGNLVKENFGLSKTDLDHPHSWFNVEYYSRRFGGLENWVKNIDDIQVHDFLVTDLPEAARNATNAIKASVYDPEFMRIAREFFEETVLKYVKQYPDTAFHLVLPPYFRYFYANLLKNEPEKYSRHQDIIRFFVDEASKLPNLYIYGFEDEDFPDDIANYKDTLHFHQRYNSYFLDCIASGKKLLTPANVENYLKSGWEKAWNFDIGKLNNEALNLIKQGEKIPHKKS